MSDEEQVTAKLKRILDTLEVIRKDVAAIRRDNTEYRQRLDSKMDDVVAQRRCVVDTRSSPAILDVGPFILFNNGIGGLGFRSRY